jgi:hypothetical protein
MPHQILKNGRQIQTNIRAKYISYLFYQRYFCSWKLTMERNFVSPPENEGHFRGHNRSFAMMHRTLIMHQLIPHCRLEAPPGENFRSVSYINCPW